MSNYKNAEHFGYKVGDKFRYVPKALDINQKFDPNDVLTFVSDDGSCCPQFENQNKIVCYEYLRLLEKLEEINNLQERQQQVTEIVTTCPSAAIQEMLLTCFDDSVNVTISMDSIKVKWQGSVFVVSRKASLKQIIEAINLLSSQQT